jgi:hypothetical protein
MMSNLKTRIRRCAVSLFVGLALNVGGSVPILAQSGGSFQITNSAVAGGGGESKDATNRFGLESTIGEHAAGTVLRNPPYSQIAGLLASHVGFIPIPAALIRGRILTSGGTPLPGVTINLSGSSTALAITDANGVYSFFDIEFGGAYTVTPSRVNYSFSPQQLAFSLMADKTDADFTATSTAVNANPLDTPVFFVREQYLDFLNREPDASGLAFWTNEITSCGTDVNCTDVKRINVSAAFYLSIEFQETGYLVYRLHQAAFNSGERLPLDLFRTDNRQIGLGVVVGQLGWEQLLEQNKQAFVNQFVARPTFVAAYPVAMTPAQFVDALNANTGGSLSQAERDAFVADLLSGAKTRAQVLRGIAEDDDFVRREFTRAFVLMQYFGYLRRAPNDLPDTNFDGYNFWLAKLNQFNGNFINAEMVKAFIMSSEYRNRFTGP